MEARTTPFTRMQGLSVAYRADRAMIDALERGGTASERLLQRMLRALGQEYAPAAAPAATRPTLPA